MSFSLMSEAKVIQIFQPIWGRSQFLELGRRCGGRPGEQQKDTGRAMAARPLVRNSKICTSTHTGRAKFLPNAVVAGGSASRRVEMPK
jgi:hypothetical protein